MVITLRGDATQRLPDHALRFHRCTEQATGHLGDGLLLFDEGAACSQRRGSAHALQTRILTDIAHPAHQERHIRALASAIGVQLIQHQETQAPQRSDNVALVRAG
ncbi:MAG: hypothetical protein BWY25_02655 [Chloroflexi bacterium ADurb.Bin222]|nr:MAG: hypothetical protein BWY25_02655 [Chloroflexi bacterium ADurb.Bin222]